MHILGLSSFAGRSAAALLKDGSLEAVGVEERFSRVPDDDSFPEKAIRFCLERAGIGPNEVEYAVFCGKPLRTAERELFGFLERWPGGFLRFHDSLAGWASGRLSLPGLLRQRLDYRGEILFAGYNRSLAAGAYFSSRFREAAILIVNGGEGPEGDLIARGEESKIRPLKENRSAVPEGLPLEDYVVSAAQAAWRLSPSEQLCLSGGSFLKSVDLSGLIEKTPFRRIYLFPEPESLSAAVGAAFFAHAQLLEEGRPERLSGVAFGSSYSAREIEDFLGRVGAPFSRLQDGALIPDLAERLRSGDVAAWFRGRSEFTSHGAGQRVLLADPLRRETAARLDPALTIQAVCGDLADAYFSFGAVESPGGCTTAKPRSGGRLDFAGKGESVRLQRLERKENVPYYELLLKMKEAGGAPRLLCAPLKAAGEPPAETPQDAWRAFLSSDVDVLVMENCIVDRKQVKYARRSPR